MGQRRDPRCSEALLVRSMKRTNALEKPEEAVLGPRNFLQEEQGPAAVVVSVGGGRVCGGTGDWTEGREWGMNAKEIKQGAKLESQIEWNFVSLGALGNWHASERSELVGVENSKFSVSISLLKS
jgi:hypothetical protein